MNTVTIGAVEVTPLLDTRLLMYPPMFLPDHPEEFVA